MKASLPFLPLAELERRILHGLSLEWETARGVVLRPADARKMRPPLFRLRDLTGRWGCWYGEKREIALSRGLVWNHSWDAVLEVLRHEMAHQFAEEVLEASAEPAHGPKFHEACLLLRANPRASGVYPPLDERISRESPHPEDKILRKVKKLFALAQSQNPHEAQAAMNQAHALVAKYNVNLLARDEERSFIGAFLGRPRLQHNAADYRLGHLLLDNYFVRGIWVSAYVPEKEKMGHVFEVSGTIPNVKIAGYIYDFVSQYIHAQWAEYNKDKQLNHFRRTDFAVGIIEGFRSKLESAKEGEKEESGALVRLEDPLLQEYMGYKYPRTRRVARGVSRRDARVISDGRRIGQKMVIARGISDPGGFRGLLIGQ